MIEVREWTGSNGIVFSGSSVVEELVWRATTEMEYVNASSTRDYPDAVYIKGLRNIEIKITGLPAKIIKEDRCFLLIREKTSNMLLLCGYCLFVSFEDGTAILQSSGKFFGTIADWFDGLPNRKIVKDGCRDGCF
jgi:hypothetical protein